MFTASLLSFLEEKPGKLTSFQAVGKVTLDKECTERAQAFNLCNFMLPTVPVEDYSCGFWVAEIMLQLCLNKVSLVDVVNVTFDLDENRKYLFQLMGTRFLVIVGFEVAPTYVCVHNIYNC